MWIGVNDVLGDHRLRVYRKHLYTFTDVNVYVWTGPKVKR